MELEQILSITLRTLLGFITLVISMKIMGKREIGELSLFDFLIVLTIADIMIIGVEHYDQSMLYFIIPLGVVVILQKFISIIDLKFPRIRNFLEGKEVIIIYNGKLIIENMKKEKYNMNDLYTQLRAKDIRSIDEVEYAVLETNGNLSVFKYDQQLKAFPLPIIVSGKLDYDNLKYTNFDEKWIIKELKRQNIIDIKEVYGASIVNDKLIITKYKKTKTN